MLSTLSFVVPRSPWRLLAIKHAISPCGWFCAIAFKTAAICFAASCALLRPASPCLHQRCLELPFPALSPHVPTDTAPVPLTSHTLPCRILPMSAFESPSPSQTHGASGHLPLLLVILAKSTARAICSLSSRVARATLKSMATLLLRFRLDIGVHSS